MIENYSIYRFSPGEFIKYLLQGMLITAIVGELFYRSLISVIPLSPIIIIYLKTKKKELISKRRWKLNLEFKDAITGLAASLSGGYSAEHALNDALKDLYLLYDSNSMIIKEFTFLVNQLKMNITIERALMDFGERTGIDDIISFAEVFTTAKRTGGDLVGIIRSTSNTINDKVEVKREIITMLAGKKYEAGIMKVIPLAIILYLSVSSPGFLEPLYHNVLGIAIMSILLLIYLGAYMLSEKIIAIEI